MNKEDASGDSSEEGGGYWGGEDSEPALEKGGTGTAFASKREHGPRSRRSLLLPSLILSKGGSPRGELFALLWGRVTQGGKRRSEENCRKRFSEREDGWGGGGGS